jgi:hypothetical protein
MRLGLRESARLVHRFHQNTQVWVDLSDQYKTPKLHLAKRACAIDSK